MSKEDEMDCSGSRLKDTAVKVREVVVATAHCTLVATTITAIIDWAVLTVFFWFVFSKSFRSLQKNAIRELFILKKS